SVTGFPEILGGRVKTLHPKIMGGILADLDDPFHRADLNKHAIEPIGLVCVNLYPFEEMLEKNEDDAILREFIDIGGVSLIRAAAKNHPHVIVLTDTADYAWVAGRLKAHGDLTLQERRLLAYKAFEHTAQYDALVANYFRTSSSDISFPKTMTLRLKKAQDLRYGENPHQQAALYQLPKRHGGVAFAKCHQGKELSFNNYLDLEAAWRTIREFEDPACVIIKHTNPCGLATAPNIVQAFSMAMEADPVSAFGGIVGFNREVDPETAQLLAPHFLECVVAPAFHEKSLEILKAKKNLRVLTLNLRELVPPGDFDFRNISGGFLAQQKDTAVLPKETKVVTKKEPTDTQWLALRFAWKVAKHVKSNAIVLATPNQALGIGGGQTSRIDSLKIASAKLKERKVLAKNDMPLVMASDGFFPFGDSVLFASQQGVSAIIQPGGSIRDEESIKAADELGIAMVFTGMRHFLH
ncbi:MAG: bifunctional phosphoribosylaminoimidazolecarboxamide formyltransferase/IMP cyclohydrolase, partial [Elusimicrobiota bacterium]